MPDTGPSRCDTQPVTIVGGGPVGMALALSLAKHNIRSVVLEADDAVCDGSRAICLSRRTLEILDRLGVLRPFLEKGLPWTSGRSFHEDTLVHRFTMPNDDDQRLPPMINLQQYYIESFLAEEIVRHADLIDMRWGTEVVGFSDAASRLVLTARKDGTEYEMETNYVAACDGARSKVRSALGLKMSGVSYEGRYVIADIRIKINLPTERLAWFDPPSNRGRTVLMHRQPDDLWRIDYQMLEGENAEEMTKTEALLPVIQAHLDMMKIDAPWDLVWSSSYRASAISLDRYTRGRVMFLGDAAHLVPIFGVRGLNSGFDDAFNLGWKLAAVMKDKAPEIILSTYSQERRAAWQINVAHALKSTDFMSPPSRGFTLMRDAALRAGRYDAGLAALVNPRQSSAIVYEGSELTTRDGDGDAFAGMAMLGGPLPECPLMACDGARIHLTQLLRDTFVLLVYDDMRFAQAGAGIEGLEVLAIVPGAYQTINLVTTVRDKDGRFAALFDARPGSAFLVRPDGHLCARWRKPDLTSVTHAIGVATMRVPSKERAET